MSPRIISLTGLFVMVLLAWLMSAHKTKLPFRIIIGGMLLQFGLALAILKTTPGQLVFDHIGQFFNATLGFVDQGSQFVFGVYPRPNDPELPPSIVLLRSFAFGVLPTIIFFSSLMGILYYLGIMQKVVNVLAWVMQKMLNTSGAESLSAAANIFVGQTEAPLVIQPYVKSMTTSELMAVMVGGFSTIAGGVLAAYVGMGIDASHLLTASVISAPAALVIAKVMQPEIDEPETRGTVRTQARAHGTNVIESAAIGASDGMKLALNVGAMLIAFLALIAMFDAVLIWVGSYFDQKWTIGIVLGYVFYPLAWIMGIEQKDCLAAGQLLGIKMAANEFIAFDQLARWMSADSAVKISERSELILTYALCGFANFGSIGIQIGGIGGIAPERQGDLARLSLRAMLGGTLACCMTACIAGILM